jgi:transcriptional regulator GlxA family with amidase domain
MKQNVAILLFDDVEVLDFAGPFEVFSVTDELNGHDTFNVYTVANSPATVRARNGLLVMPRFTTESCPAPDIFVVPGGHGTRPLLEKPLFLEWVRNRANKSTVTLSVCTGSLILAKAGVLDGLRATTHHNCLALLRELAPNTEVVETDRFVDNGRIITTGGVSAGIDGALHVVQRLLGAEAAKRTAEYMEYRLT